MFCCERELYKGTAPEQKTKNAKSLVIHKDYKAL